MKKHLLLIGLSILTLGVFAEGVPTVSVSKSQGGWTAVLNLYNYVNYTPAELTDNGIGQLTCQGSGFTWCRIPNCSTLTVNDATNRVAVTDQTKLNMFSDVINEILEHFENEELTDESNNGDNRQRAQIVTSYSKKLSMKNSSTRGKSLFDSYVIKGIRKINTSTNEEKIDIFVDKVSLF